MTGLGSSTILPSHHLTCVDTLWTLTCEIWCCIFNYSTMYSLHTYCVLGTLLWASMQWEKGETSNLELISVLWSKKRVAYGELQGYCFWKGGSSIDFKSWRTRGRWQGKNNLCRETYKWKDPNGLQELQEASISEQDEQTEAVIRQETGKLGRGWIMWGLVGLGRKLTSYSSCNGKPLRNL